MSQDAVALAATKRRKGSTKLDELALSGMASLPDRRLERFAMNLMRSRNKTAAYRDAGFKDCRSGASRAAARPDVKARIQVLRTIEAAIMRAGEHNTILLLMTMAESPQALSSAAGMREARIALLEAHRLRCLRDDRLHAVAAAAANPPERELTEDEWTELFGSLEAKNELQQRRQRMYLETKMVNEF